MKVLSIFGTRPEAIKMAPVVHALERHQDIESLTCVTAQHRQMLDQVLEVFGIRPDIDLGLMQRNQTLAYLTARTVEAISNVLQQHRPDVVLVQGDTTTAMASALAGFYEKTAIGHVEAGLRTFDQYSPFPEEVNRRIIGTLATFHFAPTPGAQQNLLREGVSPDSIFITGNTVVDALRSILRRPPPARTLDLLRRLRVGEPGDGARRTILVTAHRRESFGRPFENVCRGLLALAQRNPDVQLVYPVHMNPNVRGPVNQILAGKPGIHLIEPLTYESFAHLLHRAYLVITDSGGIQEEAPALGRPVLVVRCETERPEAVVAGCVKVIGTDTGRIVSEAELLLHNREEYERMARAISPYGDGRASERIVEIVTGRERSRVMKSPLLARTAFVH